MTNDVVVNGNAITIIYNGQRYTQSVLRIYYCESYNHQCKIWFDLNQFGIAPIGINKLAERVPPIIIGRCHENFLINFAIMQDAIITEKVILYEDRVIPISRYRRQDFLKNIDNYINSEFYISGLIYYLHGPAAKNLDLQINPNKAKLIKRQDTNQ